MTVSYNGWSASPSSSSIGITKYRIPGTSETIWLRRSAAPILLWAMDYWNRNIEPIQGRQLDDWGYAYRATRGGGSISNHASGTAVDINALQYPRGRANMSAVKVMKVRAMVRRINQAAGKTLIKWGGEWSGAYKDQMHLELGPGTNATDVQRAVRALSDLPNIYQANVRRAMKATTVRGRWSAKTSIARLQRRLVAKGHLKNGTFAWGYAGRPTREAYARFERVIGNKGDVSMGLRELRILASGVYEIVPE